MITTEFVLNAIDDLREHWGEDAEKVLSAIWNSTHFVMSCSDFLNHCTACGGNWSAMFLTGIKEIFPKVYEAIPNDLGSYALGDLLNILLLLGIDTSD